MRKRILRTPAERGKLIRDIRLALAPVVGDNVSQARMGQLVGDYAGLETGFNQSTVKRWEEGAEPGLIAGCALAGLGGIAPDALVFRPTEDAVELSPEEAEPAESSPTLRALAAHHAQRRGKRA